MYSSSIIRCLPAGILLSTAINATAIEPSVPALLVTVSHVPSPVSDNFLTIYGAVGTPSPALPGQNITLEITISETGAEDVYPEPASSTGIRKRSYTASCDTCSLRGGSLDILQCRCHAQNGSWGWTNINLNMCLENNDGFLRWRYNGNFANSCFVSPLDGARLWANCWTHDRDLEFSGVNLSMLPTYPVIHGIHHCILAIFHPTSTSFIMSVSSPPRKVGEVTFVIYGNGGTLLDHTDDNIYNWNGILACVVPV